MGPLGVFLHVTSGPDNTNNVKALALFVLIVTLVVVGSLLIMTDLNDDMMPAAELMNLRMQHCIGSLKENAA
jgi:cytochrome o ubiquinol oxidase operon protein cyoD